MTNAHKPVLLTDDQMKAFIRDGVLLLKTDFPRSFHEDLVNQLNEVYAEEGNPGNNILPRIRDIQKVFEPSRRDGRPHERAGTGLLAAYASARPLQRLRPAGRLAQGQLLGLRSDEESSPLLGDDYVFPSGYAA